MLLLNGAGELLEAHRTNLELDMALQRTIHDKSTAESAAVEERQQLQEQQQCALQQQRNCFAKQVSRSIASGICPHGMPAIATHTPLPAGAERCYRAGFSRSQPRSASSFFSHGGTREPPS